MTGRDISERIRSERELKKRQQRLQALLNAAADAIITINEQGHIESFNPAAERLFGYRADEAIGQNIKTMMPSPYHDEHDDYLARYLETGQARIIGTGREVMARRKDGSTLPVDLARPGQRQRVDEACGAMGPGECVNTSLASAAPPVLAQSRDGCRRHR